MRNRLLHRTVTAALAGLTAFVVTACGNDQTSDQTSDQTGGEPNASSTLAVDEKDAASPGSELDLETAKEFVKITVCAGAPAERIGVTATLEVTNTLDEPIEYYGSLNFLDGSGATIAEGVFNTGTIEPGATTTEEIPGANIYEPVPEVTCELTEVKSDEPA